METTVKKAAGGWKVQFSHEGQKFTLWASKNQTEKEAEWQKQMLDKCFEKFMGNAVIINAEQFSFPVFHAGKCFCTVSGSIKAGLYNYCSRCGAQQGISTT